MPLSSISKHGAKQCTAKSKRTSLPCINSAAFGCRTCVEHGARRPESIKRGEQHPNYVHGNRTLESQKEASEQSARLQMLEDALHLLGMTTAKRSRGRKSARYCRITSVDEIKKAIG